MSLLSQSEYTKKNTDQFVEQVRMKQVPDGYKMMMFDVNSLFTNVPLAKTTSIDNQYKRNQYRHNSLQKTNKYQYLIKLELTCTSYMEETHLENNA